MIKIAITLVMMGMLIACQDVKKQQTDKTDHSQNTAQPTQVASTVREPASQVVKEDDAVTASMPQIEAKPSAAHNIPKVVQDYVADLQSDCQPKDKIKLKDAVRLIDVLGDEQPEYLIEADDLICYEYISDRGNSSGRDLTLFAQLPNGETKQVLHHVMYDYRIEPAKPKPKIYLGIGGGYCGQNMQEISRSEAMYCERLLEWDAPSQQFVLGKMLVDATASTVQE